MKIFGEDVCFFYLCADFKEYKLLLFTFNLVFMKKSVLTNLLLSCGVAVFVSSCNGDEEYYENGKYTLARNCMTRAMEPLPGSGSVTPDPTRPMSYYDEGSWSEKTCHTVCDRLMEFDISVSWDQGMFPNRISASSISLSEPEASFCVLTYNFTKKVDWVGVFKEICVDADIAVADTLNKKYGSFHLQTTLKPKMELFEKKFE